MAGSVTINLLAGMKAKLTVPDYPKVGNSWFPRTNDVPIDEQGNTVTPTNGFWVEDDTVGEITPVDGELAVEYHHKKSSKNVIWFEAATGERCVIHIGMVPIHDHSSVVQGGPAYGTYFSDDQAI